MFPCVAVVYLIAHIGLSQAAISNTTKNITSTPLQTVSAFPCQYAPGLKVGEDSHVEQCCHQFFNHFSKRWFSGKYYLTFFFETLKEWNCSQFEDQCKKRTFAYTPLANLIYDRFCNSTILLQKCEEKISSLLHINQSIDDKFKKNRLSKNDPWLTWEDLVFTANFSIEDQLDSPCVQIAMYDNVEGGFGNYHEIINILLPFCGFSLCAYGGETLKNQKISNWSCMSKQCKVSNIIAMIVVGILCIAVIIANLTVLHVLSHYRNLRNSQAYYKASLAVADLLVGLIVLPNFIVSETNIFLTRHSLGQLETVEGYFVNETNSNQYISSSVQVRSTGTQFIDKMSKPYLHFVGFITTVSLTVSIYTLMVATFDRFWAVFRPMRFIKNQSKRNAKYISLFLWLMAFLLASLPFFVPGLDYGVVASVLVCFSGTKAAIFYAVAFLVPLIVVWTATVATFCVSRKEGIQRRILTRQNAEKKLHKIEWRLTKTLAIMVLAFSFCLIPVIIVSIIPFLQQDVYIFAPETLNPSSLLVHTSLEYVSIIILMSNSLWNCLIYNMKNRDFNRASRQSYGNLMRKIGMGLSMRTSNDEIFSSSMRGHRRKRFSSATPVTTESKM